MIASWHGFHPEHAAAGLTSAAAALVLERVGLARAADLASLGLVAWLAFDQQLPGWAVIALLALLVAARLRGPGRTAGLAVAALVVALERPHAAPAGTVLALAGIALAVAGTWDGPVAPPSLVTAGLVGAAMGATVLGGPDTESAIAAGAGLVPVLLVGGRGSRGLDRAGVGHGGWAPLAVAVIVCVDAYRGRPAGLPAAAVAVAAVVAAAWARRLARTHRSDGWTVRRSVGCVIGVAVAAAGAARTIGLDDRTSIGAVVVSLALVGWVAGVVRLSAPTGPARTPPG